jgi:DNA-binding FadR family transcriptional regulator
MIAIRSRYPLGYVNLRTAAANQRDTYDAIVAGDPAWIRRSIDEHVGAFEQIMLGRRLSFC